jgi:hypothetical protein
VIDLSIPGEFRMAIEGAATAATASDVDATRSPAASRDPPREEQLAMTTPTRAIGRGWADAFRDANNEDPRSRPKEVRHLLLLWRFARS